MALAPTQPLATPRPRLAFRLGVTGTRHLDGSGRTPESIEADVADVLVRLRAGLDAIARHPEARAAYAAASGEPILRLLSPLARGADRLVARAALDPAIGASLFVPMPFPQEDYEADFDTAEDLAEFRALLSRADEGSLALDGIRSTDVQACGTPGRDPETAAYEAVGRLVVRQSDLVVAIWDGKPARGRGGTGDIVRYAAALRVPVIWIHADVDRPPRFITGPLDLGHPPDAPLDWTMALDALLADWLPPDQSPRRGHGPLDALAAVFRRAMRLPHDPLERFYAEQPRPPGRFWRAYGFMMSVVAAPAPALPAGEAAAVAMPSDVASAFWLARHRLPDAAASDYAARYRSTYVWVFLLATLSVIAGGTALAAQVPATAGSAGTAWLALSKAAAILEFLLLLAIPGLVIVVKANEWHERSIEYRILGELCRKQQALVALGWGLSITSIRTAAGDPAGGGHQAGGSWVTWLFAAWQRSAPFTTGVLDAPRVEGAAHVIRHLVSSQLRYHGTRRAVAQAASRTLERWGLRVFVAVLACVLVKLVLAGLGPAPPAGAQTQSLIWWLGLVLALAATVLPGVSASFVGVRAYAEFELLAAQSAHMIAELASAEGRLDRILPDGPDGPGGSRPRPRPLTSQDLGAEAAVVAATMLQDLEGWSRLFRVKAAELG